MKANNFVLTRLDPRPTHRTLKPFNNPHIHVEKFSRNLKDSVDMIALIFMKIIHQE